MSIMQSNNIKIGEETSQESFGKLFKPVTSKLDDVIDSNLNSRMLQRRKLPTEKGEVPDYSVDIDPYEDMDVEGLIDFGDYVPPQQDKQLGPIHVDPPDEPPEYDYNEEVDYTIHDEDLTMDRLNELTLAKYQDLEKVFNDPKKERKNKFIYFQKTREKAEKERNRLKGSKANITKKYNKGEINEAVRKTRNKKIDDDRAILTEYIKFNEQLVKELEKKGSGIKARGRKRRGGNVTFFNDPNQLLKKLELIIGEILAGNTSIKMRNMGVDILDTLLRMSTINRPQYNKIYNNYLKI